MGNQNAFSLSKYPTKWNFQNPFSNSETLYLWSSFLRMTNGKDKFSFSSFLKICLTYRPNSNNSSNYEQMAKVIFRIMDIDSDDVINFEDYVQTCFIITRGCIESKLEILFYLLKDQIGSKMSKINLKKKLDDLSLFVCPVRSKELNIKFADGEIGKELKIINSLFQDDEKQILEQTFIQRFFRKVNEALHMICILELLILPLTFGLENKMKNKIYKLPLMYINIYELHRQSHTQYFINKSKKRTESKLRRILIKPIEKNVTKDDKEDIKEPKDNKSTSNEDIKKSSSSNEEILIQETFEKRSTPIAKSNENILEIEELNKSGDQMNKIRTNESMPTLSRNNLKNLKALSELSQNRNLKSLYNQGVCSTCGETSCNPICNPPNLSNSGNNNNALSNRDKEDLDEYYYNPPQTNPLKRSFKPKEFLDKKVPLGIYLICKHLMKKMKNSNYNANNFEEAIWTKPNKSNCQAIQSAFELNLAQAILLKHFTFPELLHSLKNILLEMPSPLITWSLSITALSISLEKTGENERRAFLKNLLESLPCSHLSTIRCLVECFSSISQNEKKIQSSLASFFGSCFVRFADSEDRLAYTPFESLNLKSSIETTPKDFVIFLLEEKNIFSQFNFDEISNYIDETVRTPFLHSLVNTSRIKLSYSDQYINPILNSNKHSTKTLNNNNSSSYSTESYYISSNAVSSSQRSDSKNSVDYL